MKKFLFFISLFLFIPFKINAASDGVSVSCAPTTAVEGKVVSCAVSISSDRKVKEITADMEINNNLDYSKVESNNGLTLNSSSARGFRVTSKEGVSSGAVATIKVKVKNGASSGVAKVFLKNIKFDGSRIVDSSATGSVTIKSINNKLNSLQVSSGSLSPKFSANTQSYNLKVNTSSVIIKASLADSKSSFVSGYGPRTVKLGVGENKILIKIKSESGSIRTYVLNITRTGNNNTNNNNTNNNDEDESDEESNASKINTLKSLKVSDGTLSPKFNSNTTSYTLETEKDSINIEAELTDENSSFVDEYGPREIQLDSSLTEAEIKVQSENGNVKTYVIKITKKEELFGLSSLTLSEGTINFEEGVTDYTVNLSKEVKNIVINATLANEEDKFVSGYGPRTVNLNDGNNTILVKTVTKDNKETVYTINIIRGNATYSSNNYLSKLSIRGYDIIFDKTKFDYNISIKDEKSLSIEAIPEDENSLVEILNNSNLANGSIIEIKVTSEDGTPQVYTITITKQKNNMLIYIIAGCGISIALIVTIILIITKKKNKKLPPQINEEQNDINEIVDMNPIQPIDNNINNQAPIEEINNQNINIGNIPNDAVNNTPETMDIFNMNNVVNNNPVTSNEEIIFETEPSNKIEKNSEVKIDDDKKVCPHCGTVNFKTASKCFMCKKDI